MTSLYDVTGEKIRIVGFRVYEIKCFQSARRLIDPYNNMATHLEAIEGEGVVSARQNHMTPEKWRRSAPSLCLAETGPRSVLKIFLRLTWLRVSEIDRIVVTSVQKAYI